MSVESSPPVQPPQLSPDGKWVWDGTQWRPVVTAEPVHAGVFPAFSAVAVEAPDPAAQYNDPTAQFSGSAAPLTELVAPPPIYRPPAPAVDYSYQQADEPVVPLWQQTKGTGINMFLYPIAGLAVLVMAMIVLNSIGYIQLPFVRSSSTNTPAPAATPSPTPDFSGPESARADRLLKSLTPAVAAIDKTLHPLNLYCFKTLASNCYDAISATDPQVKNLATLITNGDIPKCIAAPMARVSSDVQQMDKQLQLALSGFQDNSSDELYTGIYRFNEYQLDMTQTFAVVNQARTKCYTIVLPTWVP